MPAVRRLEQPRRDRRPRARARPETATAASPRVAGRGAGRPRRHRRGRRPAPGDRHRRARPRPRRRARPGFARPASAASRASASPRSCSRPPPGSGGRAVLYATGEESAGQVRLRAGRLGLLDGDAGRRVEVLAEHDVGRIVEVARAASTGARHRRLDPDRDRSTSSMAPAGSVGQVREATVRLMDLAKGEGIAVVLVGPRDQGRLDRRAQDAGAPRRRGPRRSRASATRRSGSSAGGQEPVRLDRGGRRLRDGRRRACSR